MYLEFYELKAKPFQITSDPKFLWLGDKHKEALATLRYGIMDNRGFLLLTGEVGTGKTVLINRLVTMLDIGTVVATIPDPDLVSLDFYNLLADGFQMNRTFDSKGAFLINLRDFLHQSYADQKQVLLVIDESQRLNHRLMEDIRVLSNIELHDQKLINIFFVGQPEFNNILMTPQNRALAQRITIRYHIDPLNREETEAYVSHRLKMAGSKRRLFKPGAVPGIFEFSGGVPRLINIICDHALLTGFSQGKKEIDNTIIQECAQELRIPGKIPAVEVGTPISDQTPKQIKDQPTESATQSTSTPPIRTQMPESPSNKSEVPGRSQGPVAWQLILIILVAILIGWVIFTMGPFKQDQGPRWGSEELTPQKYLTSLEKEKQMLATRMEEGAVEPHGGENNPSVQAAASPAGNDQNAMGADGELKEGEIAPLPLMKETIVIPFSLNSNEIEPASFPVLNRIALYLKNHPDEIVFVRGFTDSRGSSTYNKSVSGFRANAVKSFLIGRGAPADNIQAFAMGDASPIASNTTAEGRVKNRRVEIEFPTNAPTPQ